MDLAADLASEARMHVRHAGAQAVGGAKGFGSDILRQILGGNNVSASMTSDQLAKKQEDSKELDNQAYIETRARVQSIYDEHRAKRQREEQAKQQQEFQHEEAKKMQEITSKRTTQHDVAVAMGKGSAETGRNYGAE